MTAKTIRWISVGGSVLIIILAFNSLVILTAAAIAGGGLPRLLPGGAQSAVTTQGLAANTQTPSAPPLASTATTQANTPATPPDTSALQNSLSIAERNTAWASYVLAAVGVLFTIVAIVTTLTNEMRGARLEERWDDEEQKLSKANKEMADGLKRLEQIEKGMPRTIVAMAEYMVSDALLQLMDSAAATFSSQKRSLLNRTAQEGVKILVICADTYRGREAAVRRLSRVIHASTLECLNEIELMAQKELAASTERDELLNVIRTTRSVVAEALAAQARPGRTNT